MTSLKRFVYLLMAVMFSGSYASASEASFRQNLQEYLTHSQPQNRQLTYREFLSQTGATLPPDLKKDFQGFSDANPDLNVPLMKKSKFQKNGDFYYEMKAGTINFTVVMNEEGFTITPEHEAGVHFDYSDAFNNDAFLKKLTDAAERHKNQKKVSFRERTWIELLIAQALAAEGDCFRGGGYIGKKSGDECKIDANITSADHKIWCNPALFGHSLSVTDGPNSTADCIAAYKNSAAPQASELAGQMKADFLKFKESVSKICMGDRANSNDCKTMTAQIRSVKAAINDNSMDFADDKENDHKAAVDKPKPDCDPKDQSENKDCVPQPKPDTPPAHEEQKDHAGKPTSFWGSMASMAIPFLLMGGIAAGLYFLLRPRPPVVRKYIYAPSYNYTYGGTTTTTTTTTGSGVDGTGSTAAPAPGFSSLKALPAARP